MHSIPVCHLLSLILLFSIFLIEKKRELIIGGTKRGHPEEIMKVITDEEQLGVIHFILTMRVFICTCSLAIPKAFFSTHLCIQPKETFMDHTDLLMFSSSQNIEFSPHQITCL